MDTGQTRTAGVGMKFTWNGWCETMKTKGDLNRHINVSSVSSLYVFSSVSASHLIKASYNLSTSTIQHKLICNRSVLSVPCEHHASTLPVPHICSSLLPDQVFPLRPSWRSFYPMKLRLTSEFMGALVVWVIISHLIIHLILSYYATCDVFPNKTIYFSNTKTFICAHTKPDTGVNSW